MTERRNNDKMKCYLKLKYLPNSNRRPEPYIEK